MSTHSNFGRGMLLLNLRSVFAMSGANEIAMFVFSQKWTVLCLSLPNNFIWKTFWNESYFVKWLSGWENWWVEKDLERMTLIEAIFGSR